MGALKDAELAGFVLKLIDENLRRTPHERAIEHQRALNLALELERAGMRWSETDALYTWMLKPQHSED